MGQHNNVKREEKTHKNFCLKLRKVRKEIYKKLSLAVYVRKNQFHVHPREKNENKKNLNLRQKKYKKKEMKKKYQ